MYIPQKERKLGESERKKRKRRKKEKKTSRGDGLVC
jgi:hypothetical protein